ncbi:MAG: asparagine synthase (glutamine-hydrolyzing) [Dongiaceae bacterium]
MCGIGGVVVFGRGANARVSSDELVAMREAMRTRGPDGAGLWISSDGTVGFCHRRLAIIDPRPESDQPMQTADGAYRIVFNGEILNYRELRAELAQHGDVFRTGSDTEVLLQLYARHGPAMVGRLRGMFAFAIWDEARRHLFAARDPFGIRPFYYAAANGVCRFASQVKALRAGGGVETTPEPAGHVGFLLLGYVPEPYTLHREIRALPAGHTLTVSAEGARLARYFDIPATLAAAAGQPVPDSPQARRALLRDALLDSVRHHLVADVTVGIFLSAGLDSTALLALGAELAGPELRTVTLGFPECRGTENDETGLARESARQLGAAHATHWIDAADFAAEHDRLLAAMDQPSIDGVNTYFVARAAARSGLKVALSGLGGDELFGSYPSFGQIPRLVRRLGPLRRAPALGRALRRVSAPALRRLTSPKYAGLLEYGTDYGGAYLLRRGLFMPWELPGLLDPEMVREGWKTLDPLTRLERTTEGVPTARAKVSALELSWYMRGQLLRDADWAGLAHSVEVRPPLVDSQLLQRLAPLIVSPQPPTKSELADCLGAALPPAIRQRRKTGFVAPVADWHRRRTGRPARGLRDWALHVYREAERGR